MCGGPGPLDKEHIISKTVRNQLPPAQKITYTFAGETSKPWNVLHCVLKRAVCKGCNAGWMRDLENDFVAIVSTRIAEPDLFTISPDECERLATWAIKTTLLLEIWTDAMGQGSHSPEDNRRYLATHKTPPPRSKVWIAGIDYKQRYAWSQSLGLFLPGRIPKGCVATLTVGSFGFQVLMMDIEDGDHAELMSKFAALEPPGIIPDVVARIWPRNDESTPWPPSNKLLALEVLFDWATWPAKVFPLPRDPSPGTSRQ
jgi:hypothetical protein